MIVKRVCLETRGSIESRREGWFLFGIVPRYLREMQARQCVTVR